MDLVSSKCRVARGFVLYISGIALINQVHIGPRFLYAIMFQCAYVSGAIFDVFLEVFWIFLKNEHGKLKFHPNWAV